MFEIGATVQSKGRRNPRFNGMIGIVIERMSFKTKEVANRYPDNPYCYRVLWNTTDKLEQGPYWIFPKHLKGAES